MFSRIIFASEISPSAFNILKCLKGLRKLGAKKCLLVQCINPHETKAAISSFFVSVLEENLRKQKEILADQGYEVETRVVAGLMRNEINRIAVEEDFSIIVAGAAEQSIMGEVFFGSVAHEVIHHASRPVLLIRIPGNHDEVLSSDKECNITDHVLFPTDFSGNAEIALEFVKKMVKDGVKKVTLVHVQGKSRIDPHLSHRLEEFNEIDTNRLQEIKKVLLDEGAVDVEIQLLYGSPSAEIIRLVHEQKIPLVVMGSQGRGFVKELYLGSVSHNISRHSSASVLLVPAKREK
jgi:nucleotide-binding universal stress UspA family protein